MLSLFAMFLMWFPVWLFWPQALVSRLLTVLFGITFFVVGITLTRFSGLVDWIIKRRGRPLR
jgi:hypothetical protein